MRLVGRQRCLACDGVQRACYATDGEPMGECSFCGALASIPEGPQLPSAQLVPVAHVDAVILDAFEARRQRLARNARRRSWE